jgi:hypothetical protein
MALSENTDRQYVSAWMAFQAWCKEREKYPNRANEADIADYLGVVLKIRGPYSVPVHCSAIARSFRERGRPLDTKSDVIQLILKKARKQRG